jgi:hypothetical protein
MTRTAAVDRPDFHAWRAYRVLVDAEAAEEQTALFQYRREGRGKVGVWIHGGLADGIRIGAVRTTAWEYTDPTTGEERRRRTYAAIADAAMANGTFSPAAPTIKGLESRHAAAALLYGRWIERRARRLVVVDAAGTRPGARARNIDVCSDSSSIRASGSTSPDVATDKH